MSNKREAGKAMQKQHAQLTKDAESKAPTTEHRDGLCQPCHSKSVQMRMAQYTIHRCGADGCGETHVPYFQVYCKQCGSKEKRCYGCGAPFGARSDKADSSAVVEEKSKGFESRMEACIQKMTELSGFSSLHPTYIDLFRELWKKYDPNSTGFIARDSLLPFAAAMVDAGWKDWKDTNPTSDLAEKVGLMEFAVWAEGKN